MSADFPLSTFRSMHRALAWRLALATLVLSLLISALAYLTLRERFVELIDAVTRTGTVRVNSALLPLLDVTGPPDPAKVQAALDRMAGGKAPHLEQGRFVLIRLLDLDARQVASVRDAVDPQLHLIEAAMASRPLPKPGGRPELFRVAGRQLVLVSQPLTDSFDRPVLNGVAVFAISPETVAAYRWQLLRTMLLTFGIIFTVAIVLYPLLLVLFRRVLALSQSLMLANLDTIRVLGSAIAKRDSDTDDHNYRVTLYCVTLGEAYALPVEEMQGLIKGAFLHDVGKIGIHDRILLKPGRLDNDEFTLMKKHVDYGLDIVTRCRWLEDAKAVVGSHHEKYDGSGYPVGLQGGAIPLNARIFAVTDVFDALASRRPYKNPLPLIRCLEILAEGRGTHFDPDVVDTFSELAPDLHARYGECPPERLKSAMQVVIARYFEGGAAG